MERHKNIVDYIKSLYEDKKNLEFLSKMISVNEKTLIERLSNIAENLDIAKHYDLIAEYYKSFSLKSPEEARLNFYKVLKRYVSEI